MFYVLNVFSQGWASSFLFKKIRAMELVRSRSKSERRLLASQPKHRRNRTGTMMPFGISKKMAGIVLIFILPLFIFIGNIIHKKASGNLDEYLRVTNLPHAHGVFGTESPSFLKEAIAACEEANNERGGYPSMYKTILKERRARWRKDDHKYNFLQMIDDKLGGYIYATKLGIRTPRVLFCGKAKDISQNMHLLGNKYVIKPLKGHSSRGVKVVKDGVELLTKERVSYDILAKQYNGDEKETIVEELIESANPKYDGLIPPDFKFFVYEGGVSEIMWQMDRNKGQKCRDSFDVVSSQKSLLKEVGGLSMPSCSQDTRNALDDAPRQKAMEDAVQILASNAGPNWIRIDMFDSKDYGPVLGEFTPFSAEGFDQPRGSCIMSYLFIAHADHGAPNDDSDLIQNDLTKHLTKFKGRMRMQNKMNAKLFNSTTFDFYPQEAREWLQYDEMTKCKKKVMEAHLLEADSTQK